MLNYKLWQYRDDRNCWDFVRTVLNEQFNVPVDAVPKFGICPDDKRGMTKAFLGVKKSFRSIEQAQEGAVACHFSGRALTHVGVVLNGKVWHAGKSQGVKSESIQAFEKQSKTGYFLWLN